MLEFYVENSSAITVTFISIIVIAVLSRAFLGCWLAEKKGYSQIVWFYLCFLFGLFALLALGFAPSNIKKPAQQN
jgi:hypothetical protein